MLPQELGSETTYLELGLQTHGLPTEITDLVWDPMKFRFLMSYCRKNSVRDQVIGKKWIDTERNTLHRQECGPLQRASASTCGMASFYGLGNFIG